jgi:hypothetical protein
MLSEVPSGAHSDSSATVRPRPTSNGLAVLRPAPATAKRRATATTEVTEGRRTLSGMVGQASTDSYRIPAPKLDELRDKIDVIARHAHIALTVETGAEHDGYVEVRLITPSARAGVRICSGSVSHALPQRLSRILGGERLHTTRVAGS